MDKKGKEEVRGYGVGTQSNIRRKPPPVRHSDPSGKRAENRHDGEETQEGILIGKNAVIEALRAGIAIDKVFIVKNDTDPALRHIASTARAAGAVVSNADRRKLDGMSPSRSHQGVVAVAACVSSVTVSDILDVARKRCEAPLIVVCDEITDPHNLGAIIRTCEAAGAHGVVISKQRSAGLNATVAKTSSGAIYHISIARVSNLTTAVKELKKAGVWVFGAAADGNTSLWQANFSEPAALVIGSEGAGISRLVGENCDHFVSIPMYGEISSLNASVSAAILLYEVVRQRKF